MSEGPLRQKVTPASDEEIDERSEYKAPWLCDCGSGVSSASGAHAPYCATVFVPRLIARIDAERARADGAESERDNLAAELVSSGRVRLHARIAELEAEISRSKQLCAKEYDEQIDPASVSLDWILGGVIAGSRRRIFELEAALAEARKEKVCEWVEAWGCWRRGCQPGAVSSYRGTFCSLCGGRVVVKGESK